MPTLNDQVALVTGGASGLGKAIAQRLNVEGARVVISDVQRDLGQATATEIGVDYLEQDVCNEKRWQELVGEIEGRFGRFDILVNNAGIIGPVDAVAPETMTLTTWRRIFEVNVEGVFLGCRSAIPAMRRTGRGSIINMSSVAGLLATPFAVAYGASKAAVRHMTKSFAQYCAKEKLNIRCNSVHPGIVLTPLWLKQAEEGARLRGISVEQVIADARRTIPLGEFSLDRDIAAAVAFLAADDSRHVTGSKLVVDGGMVDCDTYLWT